MCGKWQIKSLFCELSCFFSLHVPAALRLVDQRDTCEDEDDGQGMGPLQDAEARCHADGHGHDGLHVVVGGHHRWAQDLLRVDDEDIADERAEDDDIGRFEQGAERQWLADHRQRVRSCER